MRTLPLNGPSRPTCPNAVSIATSGRGLTVSGSPSPRRVAKEPTIEQLKALVDEQCAERTKKKKYE